MQCFFMPMSPCVITEEDLKNAPILGDKNLEIFRTTGKLPKKFIDEKIIIIPLITDRLVSKPKSFQEAIINIIESLYIKKHDTGGKLYNRPLWKNKRAIKVAFQKHIYSSESELMFDDAAMLYIMRVNVSNRRKIKEILNKIVPKDFNPETAIGIPMKCKRFILYYSLLIIKIASF